MLININVKKIFFFFLLFPSTCEVSSVWETKNVSSKTHPED